MPAITTRAAIARAAERTGVDFDYLLAQARIESSLNPHARAGTSSAAGLYQFTKSTWLQTLDKHGAAHGLDWTGAAIDGGRVRDPAMRAQIMALRYDAGASALMAAELAGDNKDALTPILGREPDAAELYLAHFLGSGGAGQFLAALRSDPGQSAASLMPKAAAANRGIFFERSGAPRSVAEVMDLMRGKVAGAMGKAPDQFPASPSNQANPADGISGWGPSAWAAASANALPPAATGSPCRLAARRWPKPCATPSAWPALTATPARPASSAPPMASSGAWACERSFSPGCRAFPRWRCRPAF